MTEGCRTVHITALKPKYHTIDVDTVDHLNLLRLLDERRLRPIGDWACVISFFCVLCDCRFQRCNFKGVGRVNMDNPSSSGQYNRRFVLADNYQFHAIFNRRD